MQGEPRFSAGQPIIIQPLELSKAPIAGSRILAVSAHTITISFPFDAGRMLLWPVGTKLKVSVSAGDDQEYTFNSEIIGRDLGVSKSYTILRPYAISMNVPSSHNRHQSGLSRVIAVTSGKGGVGKTTFTINLAMALSSQGVKVFIIDTDLGTANVDVLLNITVKYNLTHLLSGEKRLTDIAIPGPGNIGIIPGGSGIRELTQLNDAQFAQIIGSFNELDGLADVVLLDTGAGISRDVSNFLLASDEVIVVTTPEPHAITDAYAIIKVMSQLNCQAKKMLVVNRAEDEKEAQGVAKKLGYVVSQYLRQDIEYLGYIREDSLVRRSLKEQRPYFLAYPESAPARNIKTIADTLMGKDSSDAKGMTGFIGKMFNLIKAAKTGIPLFGAK